MIVLLYFWIFVLIRMQKSLSMMLVIILSKFMLYPTMVEGFLFTQIFFYACLIFYLNTYPESKSCIAYMCYKKEIKLNPASIFFVYFFCKYYFFLTFSYIQTRVGPKQIEQSAPPYWLCHIYSQVRNFFNMLVDPILSMHLRDL